MVLALLNSSQGWKRRSSYAGSFKSAGGSHAAAGRALPAYSFPAVLCGRCNWLRAPGQPRRLIDPNKFRVHL